MPLVGAEGWAAPAQRKAKTRGRHAGGGGCRPRREVRVDRVGRSRTDAAEDRRCARGSHRRGDARHIGILSHARADHARADRAQGILLRRHRGRLAGCRAHRSLRSAQGISRIRVDRVRPLSGVDVAQSGGARVRGLAALPQCRPRAERKDGLSWARSLQLVQLDPIGPGLPRRRRSENRRGRARALWLPDSVAIGSRGLRPGDADRPIPHLRAARSHRC